MDIITGFFSLLVNFLQALLGVLQSFFTAIINFLQGILNLFH